MIVHLDIRTFLIDVVVYEAGSQGKKQHPALTPHHSLPTMTYHVNFTPSPYSYDIIAGSYSISRLNESLVGVASIYPDAHNTLLVCADTESGLKRAISVLTVRDLEIAQIAASSAHRVCVVNHDCGLAEINQQRLYEMVVHYNDFVAKVREATLRTTTRFRELEDRIRQLQLEKIDTDIEK